MWKSIESDPCSSRTWNKTQLEWLSWCLLSKLLAVLVNTDATFQWMHRTYIFQNILKAWLHFGNVCCLAWNHATFTCIIWLLNWALGWRCKTASFTSEALRTLCFLNNIANTRLYFVQKMKACWWRKRFTTPCSCMCYLFQECQPSTCQ